MSKNHAHQEADCLECLDDLQMEISKLSKAKDKTAAIRDCNRSVQR